MNDDYLQEVLEDTKKWLREVSAEEFIKDLENFQSERDDRVRPIKSELLDALLRINRGEDNDTRCM